MLNRFYPKVEVDKESILKRMNVVPSSSSFDMISKLYDAQLRLIKNNLDIESVYFIEENEKIIDNKDLMKCSNIVYCLTTIGAKVGILLRKSFEEKRYIDAYLINAISDEMVMKISRDMRSEIKNRVALEGMNLTKRYSPGDCSLDLSYQKIVYDKLLSKSSISVSLTDSCMIIPEKSTMYIYGVDNGNDDIDIDHDCRTCTNFGCMYRTS